MPALAPLQTSFAAGEIDPRLVARTDLKAHKEGAATLRNAWVTVGGGVRRRCGTRLVTRLEATGRLAGLVLDDGGTRLFVLADSAIYIIENDVSVATVAAPWTAAHLDDLSWVTYRGGLFICHPEIPPQHLERVQHGDWRIGSWVFETSPGASSSLFVSHQPYAKYAPPEATLEATLLSSDAWRFQSNLRVFDLAQVGSRLRFKGVEVVITDVSVDGVFATGVPQTTIADPSRTYDWEEQAFGGRRGYPAACVVYRDRLIAGGVPAMPNRLWMSRIGRPFDFDVGTGLDDEAISFALGDDPLDAVRAFSAGRELEVFTAASEWTIDGNPLAPATAFAVKQTGIGCLTERQVPPAAIDGASVFVGRDGESLIEYVFADIDTAYQAQDLALRAHHLINEPRDLAFDPRRRLLMVVSGDGSLAMATLDRHAQMVAWSGHRLAGEVRAVARVGNNVYLMVERNGGTYLDAFDDAYQVDAGVIRATHTPQVSWNNLDHLEGATVTIVGDGRELGTATVEGGLVRTTTAATTVQIGLPFSHVVEPLPLTIQGRRVELYRPLEVAFEVHATPALVVDIGEGPRRLDLSDPEGGGFTGIKRLRARGWRRADMGPLWRIETDAPLSFHLLSTTSDVKVTR